MKHARTIARLEADLRELEASADRAGLALACAFSSSDEFEADRIRVRREARLIGSRHIAQLRGALALTATAALAALFVLVA
ncbi:hypothetical protein RA307_23520 [Xanthobacteraceae bacterium Astr-EGSB]|uniref:hypothetical protein n=1 Tax=Astrobacterium formosum TaxID=3069710 RepID=UPI0027B7B666|nr:hypothetical protein [Xanthobacteraceae bacterium Astr-EGSB]